MGIVILGRKIFGHPLFEAVDDFLQRLFLGLQVGGQAFVDVEHIEFGFQLRGQIEEIVFFIENGFGRLGDRGPPRRWFGGRGHVVEPTHAGFVERIAWARGWGDGRDRLAAAFEHRRRFDEIVVVVVDAEFVDQRNQTGFLGGGGAGVSGVGAGGGILSSSRAW